MSLDRHDGDSDSQLTTVNWSTFCPLYWSTGTSSPHQLTSLLLKDQRGQKLLQILLQR